RARGLRRLPAARLRRSLRGRATRTHAALAGVHRWAIPEQAAAENRRFVLGNNPPVPTGSDPRAAVRDSGHRAVAVDARRAASRRPARDLVRSLERTTRDRWREADGGSRAIRRRLAATDRAEAHAPAADQARGPLGHRCRVDLARSLRSPGHGDDSAPGAAGHAVLRGARRRRTSRTLEGSARADP